MKRIVALLLVLCGQVASAGDESAAGFEGHWRGTLAYRGDELEVQLEIQRHEGALQASLDIPALVFAGQGIAVESPGEREIDLEFPFGVGVLRAVAEEPDVLSGGRGGFSLRLERIPAPSHVTLPVAFTSAGATRQGTLWLPDGEGTFPVVVLIAGSANATREAWSYASWTRFYLRLGIAAFIYDRRPDLEPLPDGRLAGIGDHADDVIAAVHALQLTGRVNTARPGLAGGSRGAWIAMAAANRLPETAFLVLHSVAASTPAEQETGSVLARMRRDGLPSRDLDAARDYLRLYFFVAATGKGWSLLQDALRDAQGESWLEYVDQPLRETDLAWWRANMNYDALAALGRLHAPVMASWGGADTITPWDEHRLRLEKALVEAGNTDVTTHVYPGADHRLEVGFGEDDEGRWRWFGMAPGLLDALSAFVVRTTAAP